MEAEANPAIPTPLEVIFMALLFVRLLPFIPYAPIPLSTLIVPLLSTYPKLVDNAVVFEGVPPVILIVPLFVYPVVVLLGTLSWEAIDKPFPVAELTVTPLAIVNFSFESPTFVLNSSVGSSKFWLLLRLNIPSM